MKEYFEEEMEMNPDTIPKKDKTSKNWFCEKDFKASKRCSKCEQTGNNHLACKENRILKDLWPLSDIYRKLANTNVS